MSAYVVSKTSIDVLTQGVLNYLGRYGDEVRVYDQSPSGDGPPELLITFRKNVVEDQQIIFDMLMGTCVQAVSDRYPNDNVSKGELPGPAGDDIYYLGEPKFQRVHVTPGQVAKVIDGYTYQTCEHHDWVHTPAYWLLQQLRDALLERVPGYAEAERDPDEGDIPIDRSVSIWSL